MSISSEILSQFDSGIDTIKVNKDADLHGEAAVEVTVNLSTGTQVTGTFTTNPRNSFGGVQFSGPKDISGLMVAKIKAVMEGKAE